MKTLSKNKDNKSCTNNTKDHIIIQVKQLATPFKSTITLSKTTNIQKTSMTLKTLQHNNIKVISTITGH